MFFQTFWHWNADLWLWLGPVCRELPRLTALRMIRDRQVAAMHIASIRAAARGIMPQHSFAGRWPQARGKGPRQPLVRTAGESSRRLLIPQSSYKQVLAEARPCAGAYRPEA